MNDHSTDTAGAHINSIGGGDGGGAWIGIDVGTTNCAVAVYDRIRGGSKWIRLPIIGINEKSSIMKQHDNKMGRIIPSIIIFATKQYLIDHFQKVSSSISIDDDDRKKLSLDHWKDVSELQMKNHNNIESKVSLPLYACVGKSAIEIIELFQKYKATTTKNNPTSNEKNILHQEETESKIHRHHHLLSIESIHAATVRNFKHNLLMSTTTSIMSTQKESSIKNQEHLISIQPLGMNTKISLDPVDLMTILLYFIRIASDEYLMKSIMNKKKILLLDIPGQQPPCLNVTIGVPVASTQQYRNRIKDAAIYSGFTGTIISINESTAAAMSYGMFASKNIISSSTTDHIDTVDPKPLNHKIKDRIILVFDMGGGTTDVTIAKQQVNDQRKNSSSSGVDNEDNNNLDNDHNDCDFHVIATSGNNSLGGNDMDQAIHQFIQQKLDIIMSNDDDTLYEITSSNNLIEQCKYAKEVLSGDGKPGGIDPVTNTTISILVTIVQQQTKSNTTNVVTEESLSIQKTIQIVITQQDFISTMNPIVEKARIVLLDAIERYHQKRCIINSNQNNNDKVTNVTSDSVIEIDEVILVGGASRVPSIRSMLREYCIIKDNNHQEVTPPINHDQGSESSHYSNIPVFNNELCLSIHPMSAVAQGCSIHAAMSSKLIPYHELKSALMLDTCPYPIGVLTEDNHHNSQHFVEIIEKDTTLPAANYATFYLADINQPGVTIKAVEQIIEEDGVVNNDDDNNNTSLHDKSSQQKPQQQKYNFLGEFTFLLHRLTSDQLASLHSLEKTDIPRRSIDIGMTLKDNGEFIVSIFDSNDPEHIRKRNRYQKENHHNNSHRKEQRQVYYNNDASTTKKIDEEKDPITWEQIFLIIGCFIMFLVYTVVKIVFAVSTTVDDDNNTVNNITDSMKNEL